MFEQNFHKVDLNLLIILRSLLATSSVGQTAKQLGMSQPATSRALAALRELFNDRLLVKSGSKMKPTPRALELREPLEDVLGRILQVIEPLQAFDPGTSKRCFRVACTDYGATVIMPKLAARFCTAAPQAELDIVPLTAKTFDELGSRDLDLMLYSDNPVPGAMRERKLYREEFACLVRKGHPAVTKAAKQITIQDYLKYSHILVTVTGGRTGPVDTALAALGQRRKIAFVLPYFAVAALATERSDLILTIPARAAKVFAASMSLKIIQPPVELGEFGFRLVWHERVHEDRGHIWLRKLIADVANNG